MLDDRRLEDRKMGAGRFQHVIFLPPSFCLHLSASIFLPPFFCLHFFASIFLPILKSCRSCKSCLVRHPVLNGGSWRFLPKHFVTIRFDYPPSNWRAHSNAAMPTEVAKFKLRTRSVVGIFNRRSGRAGESPEAESDRADDAES